MHITMKNIRGIVEADLIVDPIALVAAPNGGGKSSLAQAVAAGLVQHPAPIGGLDKKDAGMLLRTGTKRGGVTIEAEGGSITVNYPGGSITGVGQVPYASRYAAGLVSILDLPPKEAPAALMECIQAQPTDADLVQGLTDTGLADGQIHRTVVELVKASGYDGAFKQTKEDGAQLKGAWQEVAGEKYGPAKAEDWKPQALLDVESRIPEDQEKPTEAIVQNGITTLQADLEELIGQQAADQGRVAELEASIAEEEEVRALCSTLTAEAFTLGQNVDGLVAQLNALPAPLYKQAALSCPHCSAEVVLLRGELVKPEPFDQTEADRRSTEKGIIDQGLQGARERLRTAQDQLAATDERLLEIGRQREELAGLKAAGTVTPEQIEVVRQRIARGQALLRALQAATRACVLHAQIAQNALIQGVLAPTGVRQTVLQQKLAEFNASMATLCDSAQWPLIMVRDDLQITYNGYERPLMSASEKWRTRAVLAIATADRDGSEMVILDAADINDAAMRNGLISMLMSAGLPALVCMTLDSVEKVPNLKAIGIGRAYWIGDGFLVEVER